MCPQSAINQKCESIICFFACLTFQIVRCFNSTRLVKTPTVFTVNWSNKTSVLTETKFLWWAANTGPDPKPHGYAVFCLTGMRNIENCTMCVIQPLQVQRV